MHNLKVLRAVLLMGEGFDDLLDSRVDCVKIPQRLPDQVLTQIIIFNPGLFKQELQKPVWSSWNDWGLLLGLKNRKVHYCRHHRECAHQSNPEEPEYDVGDHEFLRFLSDSHQGWRAKVVDNFIQAEGHYFVLAHGDKILFGGVELLELLAVLLEALGVRVVVGHASCNQVGIFFHC